MVDPKLGELEPEDDASTEEDAIVTKGRQSLRRVKRELTDEELKSPVVQKFLIDEIERLESNSSLLEEYQTRFHSLDKENGVLREQKKSATAFELLSTGTISLGGVILGYTPNLVNEQIKTIVPVIAVLIGLALIAAGVYAKAAKR